jgi:putative hydrolase of the HAD superfamily
LVELGFADFEEFFDTYHKVNEQYWRFYRQGKVSKAQLRVGRFRDTLIAKKYDDEKLSEQLADFYVSHGPLKTNLFPGAIEALKYLSERYVLHLITNGFKEVQHIKVERSGLKPFFDEFIISEEIGFQKPHPEIFRFANMRTASKPGESMIIGDNLEADIAGGRNAGWGQVFFNPHKKEHIEQITHEIHTLDQLAQFL